MKGKVLPAKLSSYLVTLFKNKIVISPFFKLILGEKALLKYTFAKPKGFAVNIPI